MTYAFIKNGAVEQYPLFEGDIRLLFPNTSFPVPFSPPEGYVFVENTERPAYDHTKNLSEGTPVLSKGKWLQSWVTEDASAEEIADRVANQWQVVRGERTALLAKCDWTQLADAPVDHTAWAAYRQALRDITNQSDPFNISWPAEPAN